MSGGPGTEEGGHGGADLALAPVPHLVTELPGPRAREVIERDIQVTSPSLRRVHPLVPARAAGCVVEDVDGNRFLDANAGIGVNATGHAHPLVVEAIERQARDLIHYCSSDWYVPAYVEVCERLAAVSPMPGPTRVFLANSGTEAVEAAIKLARYATGRPNLVAFHGGFHGRSLGSLALTASRAHYRGGFGPLMPGVYHAPYGDLDALDAVLRHLTPPSDVAGIVVEPILGEGGYVVPPPGFLAGLRERCDHYGILLVADEIQSGVGRTGRMWAIEHDGVVPDLVAAGKGLASGLPLAALLAPAERMSWPPGAHASTFGGNPVACAAAAVTLDLVRDGLAANAATVGAHLADQLRAIDDERIVEVRGRGLMVAVDLGSGDLADEVEQATFQRGLLVLRAGPSAIRFAPPLVLTLEQAELAAGLFAKALAAS
jgi:4-aminobutyrate aminotransferase